MLARALVLFAAAAGFLSTVPTPAGATTLAALGSDDVSVRGMQAAATSFVRVPPGYAVAGGRVTLEFEHSPLLRSRASTVTLLAGDRPLASARLTRRSARGGTLRARLPALPLARGGFVLEARFQMRTTRACEDPENPALWARMLATTDVEPRLVPSDRTLSSALTLLAPPVPGAELDVVLPNMATPGQLAAAGVLVAGAARATAGSTLLARAVERAAADRPAIVVAGARAATVSVTKRGAPRVSAAAEDDRALERAATALAGSRLSAPSGSSARVDREPPPARRASAPWRESAASFAQLGIEPREVVGDGVSTVDLEIDRPPGWTLREDPLLELDVTAGGGVQDGSAVTVSLDGRDIGTQRLSPGSRPQRLRFEIPRGLLEADLEGGAVRTARLALRFDLHAERRRCEPLGLDGVRAMVLDTSRLTLPHETTDARDLSRFPSPLRGRVHVVLPEDPSPAERTAGLQVAAALGRWTTADAPLPRLTMASGLGTAREEADLILVGDADRALGEQVDPPGGETGEPGTGTITLRESPWSDDRVVLALGGDDAGLVRAARALSARESAEELIGSAARVRAGDAPEAVAAASPAGEPPLLLSPVEERGLTEEIPVWALPAAVVLVALLALAVLIGRRRWRGVRRA